MLAGDARALVARLRRRATQLHVAPGAFAGARRLSAAVKESAQRLRSANFIDVHRLKALMTHEELIAKADAYFANVGWGSSHARKPFADVGEATALLRSLSVLLPHLELAPGVRVLDFGAGTCWSSLIWGYLGCEVIACDVSSQALRFGEERVRADPIGKNLPVEFLHFDGRRLALDDASVDRIVGIDALHHVLDVAATLKELGRVLRPAGIAAFSEPGPLHSMSAQSQYEMSTHGVLENDIDVEAIERWALEAGFERMEVAWFSPTPQLLDVRAFNRRLRSRIGMIEARKLVSEMGNDLANIRVFFLHKAGSHSQTSRGRQGLVASLHANLQWDERRLRGVVTAKNIGSATWLPSGSGRGEVNVGLQLRHRDGTLERDFAHVPLSSVPVSPGEVAQADVDVECSKPGAIIVDLVAEGVAWFSGVGSATVTVPLRPE